VTPDGLPVFVELDGQLPAGRIASLKAYEDLRQICRDSLDGHLHLPMCAPPVREGILYRRFVDWPVQAAIHLLGEENLRGAKILHVGPGRANEARLFLPYGVRLVALDIAADCLRCTRDAAREADWPYEGFLVGPIEYAPFDDDAFDLVLLHKTVQWWVDSERGLREAFRVGKRVLLIADPAAGWVRRLAQRLRIANTHSPVTKRPINEVSRARLKTVLPSARVRVRRYIGKAIDSSSPRRWVVAVDRIPVLAALVATVIVTVNFLFGRFGNQVVAVAERDPSVTSR